jgi:membrane-bound lytic murein transglycosylase B
MLKRRFFCAATALAVPVAAAAASGFTVFLAGIRREALGLGISSAILDEALSHIAPNADVLRLDQHQPEFTLSFAQYRARVLPQSRRAAGRAAFSQRKNLFDAVQARYGVDGRIIAGIWGIESGFGQHTGGFKSVEALATLAYGGRRAAYFRSELLNALRILQAGDITPAAMTGSWAGAMGQPQFMPSSYLAYAVDFDGDGKRDIWHSDADIFASVGNYLAKNGWRAGEPWGQAITLPTGFDVKLAGRAAYRPLGAWMHLGVRRADGTMFSRQDVRGAVVIPDGVTGDAFMVYPNFHAIRKYNPSDFYALAVGLLGYAVA